MREQRTAALDPFHPLDRHHDDHRPAVLGDDLLALLRARSTTSLSRFFASCNGHVPVFMPATLDEKLASPARFAADENHVFPRWKILAWFFVNLAVIGFALFYFLRGQFRAGIDSLLAGPTGAGQSRPRL